MQHILNTIDTVMHHKHKDHRETNQSVCYLFLCMSEHINEVVGRITFFYIL